MFNLQMYYTLSTINFTKKLLSNIHGLQRDNVLCDLKIVCDNGEVWIHRPALESRKVWWCSLLRDSATNVVLLPGVSKLEVENFVGNIYGFNEIDIAAGNTFNPNVGKLLDTSTFVVFYYLLPWVMSRQLFSRHDYREPLQPPQ